MIELLWSEDSSPGHYFSLNWGKTDPFDCYEQNQFVNEQLYAQMMGWT